MKLVSPSRHRGVRGSPLISGSCSTLPGVISGEATARALRGAIAATVAFAVLAVLVPFLVCSAIALQTSSLHWNDAGVLYLAILIYSAARLAAYFGNAPPKYMAIVFFGFTYVWMGLAAFAQSASQSWPFGYAFSQSTQLEGAIIVAVGIIAYEAGRVPGSAGDYELVGSAYD